MRPGRTLHFVMPLLLAAGCTALAQQPGAKGSESLAGTAWELVRFQSGDGSVSTPQDSSMYTLRFADGNAVAVRVDCNRGRGTWKSTGPGQITFGPMALTRAACLQSSMHDIVVRQWPNIRSWLIKDGHLFLSLMADGGVFEFRPAADGGESSSAGSTTARPAMPVSVKGPVSFECTNSETFRATYYQTQPRMVLIERGDGTRPAFQVRSGSGTWYVGDSVQLREARGEATLEWAGAKSSCKPKQ